MKKIVGVFVIFNSLLVSLFLKCSNTDFSKDYLNPTLVSEELFLKALYLKVPYKSDPNYSPKNMFNVNVRK